MVEHFDQIYDALGYNAQILFGIGEEIIVARPNVFGPFPAAIKAVVEKTIKYRLMAHSAEDITELRPRARLPLSASRSPLRREARLRHQFPEQAGDRPGELEAKVKDIIRQDLPIQPAGEDRITIGEYAFPCTGTRTHVQHSGEIENFRLVKEFSYHSIFKEYMLIGIVGPHESAGYENIAKTIDT